MVSSYLVKGGVLACPADVLRLSKYRPALRGWVDCGCFEVVCLGFIWAVLGAGEKMESIGAVLGELGTADWSAWLHKPSLTCCYFLKIYISFWF
jgi:hypothetical protein